MMTAQQLDKVREDIDCEGFDNAFVHYSDYADIEDTKFHEYREEYLRARALLAKYLNVDPDQ